MKTWFSKYWVLIVLLAIAAVGHAQDKPKVAEASKTVTVKTRKTTKVMKSEGDACCRKDAAKGGATCDTKGGACKDEKCCSSRKGKDSCANGKAECKDSKCCSKDKGSCSSAKGECMDSKSCSMMTHSCPDRPGCESAKGECGMGGGHEMRVMVRTMGDDDGEPGEMGMRRIIRTRIIGGPGMGGEMGGGMMGCPAIADGQMSPGVAEELGLNADQKAKMKDALDRQQRRVIQGRSDLQIAMLDLRKLMTAEKPDGMAINAQIDKVARLRADAAKARVGTMLEIRGLLTPDQQNKLRDMHKGPGGPGRPGAKAEDDDDDDEDGDGDGR